MEAPQIVKSINRGITSMRQDAWGQAVGKTPQTASNRQAYDIMYPNHQSYYKDKRYFIFDQNYKDMENALVDTFEKAVNDSFSSKKHDYISVDELEGKNVNVNFDKIPRVRY